MNTQLPSQINSRLGSPMWFSAMCFMEQDVTFIKQLINAPIFKQNIPNLFERLTEYQTQLNDLSKRVARCTSEVVIFKESLKNYPEENTPSIDEFYYGRHKRFTEDYIKLEAEFLQLKSIIFMYLSGVLLEKTSKN